MALNCFSEAYHFLDDLSIKEENSFIKVEILAMLDGLPYESKEIIENIPQKFDKIKIQTHWSVFMRLFDVKQREKYGLKCL